MNQSQRISLSALRIRPVDNCSKLAFENPGVEYFDNRNEFILPRTMRRLACLVEVFNLTCCGQRPRRVTGSWRINVVNIATDEIVSSRDFSAMCQSGERTLLRRVDVVLTADMVHPDIRYRVEVLDLASGERVIWREMRLLSLDKAPAEYFVARSAWFEREDDPQRLTCVECDNHLAGKTVIELYCHMHGELPEVMVSAVTPSGHRTERLVRLSRTNGDEGHVVEVDMPVMVGGCETGPLYMQVDCMGYPVAGCVVEVGYEDAEGCLDGPQTGVLDDYDADKGYEVLRRRMESDEQARSAALEAAEELERRRIYASAMAELDAMTGMEGVKRQVASYMAMTQFNRRRREAGMQTVDLPLHAVFTGPAGTGKTTVARIMGRLLRGAGVLSSGHVVERERATLLGQFYNSEGENTLKAIEAAQGGILFIDEAYQLCQPHDPRDPGKFVIETLMTALSDETRRDWMVILAGYSEPMRRLFDINPGLRSRIPQTNVYGFEDYSADQLVEIARRYLRDRYFCLTPEADYRLCELIRAESAAAAEGNGRYVVNLIQTRILPAMAMRLEPVTDPGIDELSTVTAADIPAAGLSDGVCAA